MVIGVYLTLVISVLSWLGFVYFFGHLHEHFSLAALCYSIGSILSSYSFKLNVDHQLGFRFEAQVVAEAIGFTVNTFSQAFLIKVMRIDSVLSFGISNILFYLSKTLVFAYFSRVKYRGEGFDLSLSIVKMNRKDKQVYLSEGTLWFSAQLAYNTLLIDFFDQLYFLIFVDDAVLIGELTLIRGFGNMIIRFVYGPIGDITYNLYAKMKTEAEKSYLGGEGEGEKEEEKRGEDIYKRMVSIVQLTMFIFSNINYFVFAYSYNTCETWLDMFFGQNWVNSVRPD